MAVPDIPAGFDFTDPDIYTTRVPLPEFAEVRKASPVLRMHQNSGTSGFHSDWYWAVTKHADILEISRHPEKFSSYENTALIRFPEGITREDIEVQRVILLNMDPPEHNKVRQIVSRGFTPKSINAMQDGLRERAERIVRDALAKGAGDFVADIASELPLQAIADLIGVPQEDRQKIFQWSNAMVGNEDPEYSGDQMTASIEILSYAMGMAADRRVSPRDDIVSKLVHAEIDGEQLTDDQFGYFVLMLSVAGNETTRNAITHGMLAFFDNPEQWEHFKAERPDSAADEIIRWGSPITVFQRTALADTELGGQQVKAGDRLGLFYRSANFDEEVFDHPERFDITRSPNPHLGLGGFGTHYCLGANLAKMEIGLIFNAIADVMPAIRQAGEPQRLRSGWINGIKHLPVTY